MISLAAGFNDPVTTQTFEDVPPSHTFYTYIERMAERGIINGYPCGGPGEPCIPPANRPYFRSGAFVSRGQLTKMASLAFDFNEPVSWQSFSDVPVSSTFYTYTERLATRFIINGYDCGSPGEPCIPPNNLPYFRPGSDTRRGQIAKIVNLVRLQVTPTSTPIPTTTLPPSPTETVPAETPTETPVAITTPDR